MSRRVLASGGLVAVALFVAACGSTTNDAAQPTRTVPRGSAPVTTAATAGPNLELKKRSRHERARIDSLAFWQPRSIRVGANLRICGLHDATGSTGRGRRDVVVDSAGAAHAMSCAFKDPPWLSKCVATA